MRLVIATTSIATRGGMERVVLKIAEHFRAKIYCVHHKPETSYQGFKGLEIVTVKKGMLAGLPLERRLTASLEEGKYFYDLKLDDFDLINCHQSPSEWVRHNNSPVLWYCHTPKRGAFDMYEKHMKGRNPLSKAVFWASAASFRRTELRIVPEIEHIFANSRNTQGRISKYLKRESEVLYPGVEYERFRCRAYENFFFYPSRIAAEKRIEYVVEAFKLFSSKSPGWKLVVAGGLSDRPEHSGYLKKLKAISPPSVSFELNISDERLADLYSRCHATTYAPIDEDFGLVPLESMASSKPCISVNEGGPKETIQDGKDGFLVNSIWEMSEKMAWLAKHPDECARMGAAGRKKVEREFGWERFLRRFEEKAKEIAAKGR